MAEEKDGMEFLDEIGDSELGVDGLSDEEKANLDNDGHIDFGEEASISDDDSDGKGKKDEKPDASSEESKENESDKPDNKDLQSELEKIEKRRKDTEKAYQAEHQARLKLEKELDEAKKQKESSQEEDDDDDDDENLLFDVDDPDDEEGNDSDKEEKPTDDSVKAELDEVKQKTEELEKKQALEIWERASDKVREKHTDFDEVVYDHFYKSFEASPKIQEEFRKKGSTPEAAYELGLKIKGYNDALEGNKEKTDDTGSQQSAEDTNKAKAGVDPSEALGGNSSGSTAKPSSSFNDASDAVAAALAEL